MLKYKLGSIVVFVILVVFCTGIYSAYFIYSSGVNLNDTQTKYIESIRDKNKDLLDNHYDYMKDYFHKDFESINFKLLNNEKIILDEFYTKNRYKKYLKNILILDKNLEVSDKLNENVLDLTIDLIKEVNFDKEYYISNFNHSGKMIFQFISFKNLRGDYIVYIIDKSNFDKIIKTIDHYDIDIYNNQYQLIYSTKENPEFISNINSLTKRILDGNTKSENVDGYINSYTFVDFETNSIYLNVSISSSYLNAKLKRVIINAAFLIVFISVIGLVTGSLYTKYTSKGYESKSGVKSDSALLDYFGENILEAMIKVDDVIEALEKLKNLKQSLYDSNNNLNSIRESDNNE